MGSSIICFSIIARSQKLSITFIFFIFQIISELRHLKYFTKIKFICMQIAS